MILTSISFSIFLSTDLLSLEHPSVLLFCLAIVLWIIFGPTRTLLRSSKSCGCEIFRDLKYLISIFYFIHILATWSYQSNSFVSFLIVFQHTYVRTIDGMLLQQEMWLVYMFDLHWIIWIFYFTQRKYLCAIWWYSILTNSGDSYGHYLCSIYSRLISILFLYCYERDFMSNLQKYKRFNLIDKFNDTFRYIDDTFTIDNPAFTEHIPDIHPRELWLNKANTSDNKTSLLDLKTRIIGNNFHTSVNDNSMAFDFLVNLPWLTGDVTRLLSYGIYIWQLVRWARCCTSVFDFHFKKYSNHFQTINTGLQISQASGNV